ncbi:MAG: hypothetical protein ACYC33_08835 [Thermoleophilia bacterium]
MEPTACPACGDHLRPVGTKTLKHLLRYPLARRLDEGVFFHCENFDCDVVYVRGAEPETAKEPAEVFRRADIKERALPFATGSERLVCHCFGYTVGEIEQDARTGRDAIPAAISAEVRAGHCACEVMNPTGG